MQENRVKHKLSHFWLLLILLGVALLSSKCLANPPIDYRIDEPDKGLITTGRPPNPSSPPATPVRIGIDYQGYRVTEITSWYSSFAEMDGFSMKFEPTVAGWPTWTKSFGTSTGDLHG